MSDVRFLLSGDSAVTVEFGNEISEHINAQIRAFSIALTESKLPGIVELVPTYRSLMVHYDPEVIPYGALVKKLKGLLNQLEHIRILSDVIERVVCIRVCGINEVKNADDVAALQKQRRGGTQNFPLWICGYVGRISKHNVRCNDTAALARTAAADHDLQQIPLMHTPIQ